MCLDPNMLDGSNFVGGHLKFALNSAKLRAKIWLERGFEVARSPGEISSDLYRT